MRKNMSPIIKVSLLSLILNILLSAAKLGCGILGHSSGLVADSVHSLSDVVTTLIVMAAFFVASKNADNNHQYGHDKYESLASFCIAIILAYTGIKLGYESLCSILNQEYLHAEIPTFLTLVIAAISIAIKGIMFKITIRAGKRIHSDSLTADAWHHLSDSLSSIGSLLGIVCARYLGILIADKIAGVIICLFILKVAYDIGILAVKKLTDTSCTMKEQKEIEQIVYSFPQVKHIDSLKTRLFGDGYYLDLEIALDAQSTLYESHCVAESIHDEIEKQIPEVKHCLIHMNPDCQSRLDIK